MKIGFLINPIAGMGGAVGLKGTDGMVEEAMKLGAKPKAGERAKVALEKIANVADELTFFTCPEEMGAKFLDGSGFNYSLFEEKNFGCLNGLPLTSAEDTKNACKIFLEHDVDLILFCGGDGTARDIYGVIKDKLPILGIPAGVKMHSAVFGINPEAAADALLAFLHGEAEIADAEILDIDEEAYRSDRLEMKVFGYAKTVHKPSLIQGRKFVFESESEDEAKHQIARFAVEFMRDGSLYIVGAGTTTKKISDLLGLEKTMLGVDVIKNRKLIARDVNEETLLKILKKERKARILASPIGAQGFVFGRGNQQISPRVIRKVGIDNVIIVATPYKLGQTPSLLVDTGDVELDRELSESKIVITGYRIAQRKEIRCG